MRIFAKLANVDFGFDSFAACEVGQISIYLEPIQGNESNKRPPHIKPGYQNITC